MNFEHTTEQRKARQVKIWDMQQEEMESVEDYIRRVQKEIKGWGFTDKEQVTMVTNGMLNEWKWALRAKKFPSVQHIISWPQLEELKPDHIQRAKMAAHETVSTGQGAYYAKDPHPSDTNHTGGQKKQPQQTTNGNEKEQCGHKYKGQSTPKDTEEVKVGIQIRRPAGRGTSQEAEDVIMKQLAEDHNKEPRDEQGADAVSDKEFNEVMEAAIRASRAWIPAQNQHSDAMDELRHRQGRRLKMIDRGYPTTITIETDGEDTE